MGMTTEKYRVSLPIVWPSYWLNFITHCQDILIRNCNYHEYRDLEQIAMLDAFVKLQLAPHGKFIRTRTQGEYLRWDDPKYHTAFVLRWT
jgi:hypothetical protein